MWYEWASTINYEVWVFLKNAWLWAEFYKSFSPHFPFFSSLCVGINDTEQSVPFTATQEKGWDNSPQSETLLNSPSLRSDVWLWMTHSAKKKDRHARTQRTRLSRNFFSSFTAQQRRVKKDRREKAAGGMEQVLPGWEGQRFWLSVESSRRVGDNKRRRREEVPELQKTCRRK